LPPKYLDLVIGRRVTVDVARFTAVRWDMLDGPHPA